MSKDRYMSESMRRLVDKVHHTGKFAKGGRAEGGVAEPKSMGGMIGARTGGRAHKADGGDTPAMKRGGRTCK